PATRSPTARIVWRRRRRWYQAALHPPRTRSRRCRRPRNLGPWSSPPAERGANPARRDPAVRAAPRAEWGAVGVCALRRPGHAAERCVTAARSRVGYRSLRRGPAHTRPRPQTDRRRAPRRPQTATDLPPRHTRTIASYARLQNGAHSDTHSRRRPVTGVHALVMELRL